MAESRAEPKGTGAALLHRMEDNMSFSVMLQQMGAGMLKSMNISKDYK